MKHFFTKLKLGVLFTIVVFSSLSVNATHISGGDLTYKFLGSDNYEITLVLYRDCAGIPVQNPEAISCVSASGTTKSFSVFLVPGTGNEITFPCFASPTTCGGGTNPGYQRYEYKGTVNLPPSSNWNLKWVDCCRNCAITTTQNGCSDNFLIDLNMNNLLAPGDNSPIFSNYPVSLVCLGQNFTYNHGVIDAEGDSLVYQFINPRLSNGSPVLLNPGYTASNFLSSSTPITLNTNTGDINFTPSMMEIGITAISIDSYRNGVKIGTVMRDIQFIVSNCNPNILPTATGINGTNDFDTLICAGTPLCFEIYTNDANPEQRLTVTWNNGIPGGTFSTDTAAFPTATFCWTPTQADARTQPYSFTIMVKDDNCAYNAFQVYSYQVFVPFVPLDSAVIEPRCDTSERGAIYMTRSAVGEPFQWQWNTGATSSELLNLLPGNYSVVVTNVIGCVATKDFTINPAPPKLTVSCLLTDSASTLTSPDGVLEAIATGGTAPYSYLWSNGVTTMINSGLTYGTYTVSVNDVYNCQASSQCEVITRCPSISCSGYSTSCQGLNNGGATVSFSGDTTGTRIVWNRNTSLNTPTIRNLSPGTYTVVVSNNNGCLDSCSVTIPSGGCGGFRGFTQGGWGATPSGKNVASYLKSRFSTVFPTGLTIGCTNKLRLTTWQAVVDFLPSGSTARALPAGTLVNPGTSYSNVLAGQLVAAVLNVTFDSADTRFSPSTTLLGNLIIVSGPFTGWTVKQLIAEANRAIGGCGSSYSFTALTTALDNFNSNYEYSYTYNSQSINRCFLACPVSGSSGFYKISSDEGEVLLAENDWQLFPNPTADMVKVVFESEQSGMALIKIYTMEGKEAGVIMERSVESGELVETSYQTATLPEGIYIVQFTINGSSKVKRMVIMK